MWNEIECIGKELTDAGFLPANPLYTPDYAWPCKEDALRDVYCCFEYFRNRGVTPHLNVHLSFEVTVPLAIVAIQPVFRSTGEVAGGQMVIDWSAEVENPSPTDQIGKKLRLYYVGSLDGWGTLYVQTICDDC